MERAPKLTKREHHEPRLGTLLPRQKISLPARTAHQRLAAPHPVHNAQPRHGGRNPKRPHHSTLHRLCQAVEVRNLDSRQPVRLQNAYVSELRHADDPIGPDNDEWIDNALNACDKVILAWGNHGAYKNRSHEVKRMAINAAKPYHLGLNKTGEPKHPLYLPADTTPIPLPC